MCAAPSGNSFWKKRSKHGRDKLFETPELLMQAVEEYLTYVDDSPWMNKEAIKGGEFAGQIISIPTARPYTLTGLCLYLGCSSSYFREFKSNLPKGAEDFLTVISRIEEIILTQQIEGAMVGAFKENLTARLNGISDKSNVTHEGTLTKTEPIVNIYNSGPPLSSSEDQISDDRT